VLGKFHEISLETADIAESVAFYERLGFSHCGTTDTWPHPYGVMTDGRLFIGLHQFKFPSPVITYVHANVAQHASVIEKQGVEIAWKRTGDDSFNDISLCGDFAEYSMASADFEAMRQFWEPLGFVALGETDEPYVRMSMTSDYIDLAVHRPRTLDQGMLVFAAPDMGERIERLKALGVELADDLPRGLDPRQSALLRSPEGAALLLITAID
jgi:catechol 2,3-dioxygenase-like lactoylglutathione lyase family enzyme